MLQQSAGFNGECSDARLLLLVHGHRWQVPAELAERLEAAEKGRLAWYWAVKHQQPEAGSTTCLSSLPLESIKIIAWKAGIDFS